MKINDLLTLLEDYSWSPSLEQWVIDNKATIIVEMHPKDFLKLSADAKFISDIMLLANNKEDYQKYIDSGENIIPPFLSIREEDGKVVSHEGRHRAAALLKAKEDKMKVAILLSPPSRNLSLKNVPEIWHGQFSGFSLPISKVKVLDKNVQRRYNDIEESVVSEAKQVGQLYHITGPNGLGGILDSGKIQQGTIMPGTVSLSRNKNFHWPGRKGINIRIPIDGNKLSNRFKIKPFKDPETITFGADPDDDMYVSDEFEELVITKGIKNIRTYINGPIVLFKLSNLSLVNYAHISKLEKIAKKHNIDIIYSGELNRNGKWTLDELKDHLGIVIEEQQSVNRDY